MLVLLIVLFLSGSTLALISDISPPIAEASNYVEIFRRAQLPLNANREPVTSDILPPDQVCVGAQHVARGDVPLRVGIFLHLDGNYAWCVFFCLF